MQQLLVSREKERKFLESAASATEDTVANTKLFLEAQQRRAKLAEEKLERIEVERRELEEVACGVRERETRIAEMEDQLERERRKNLEGKGSLHDMETKVAKMKKELTEFEEKVGHERVKLQKDEDEQKNRMEDVGAEVARLKALLVERENRLKRESAERDRFRERHKEAERDLSVTNDRFEQTLEDLQQRRKKIDQIATQVRSIASLSKKKEQRIRNVEEVLASRANMENTENIQLEQKHVLSELARLEEKEIKAKLEVEHLGRKVVAREMQVQSMLEELNRLQKVNEEESKKAAKPSIFVEPPVNFASDLSPPEFREDGEFSSGVRGGKSADQGLSTSILDSGDSDVVSDDVGHSLLRNVSIPKSREYDLTESRDGSLHVANMTRHESGEDSAINYTVAPVADLGEEPQPKKRPGRPRKVSPADDAEAMKPKRGRGRPRKVKSEGTVAGAPSTKRSRGRPRKESETPLVSRHVD